MPWSMNELTLRRQRPPYPPPALPWRVPAAGEYLQRAAPGLERLDVEDAQAVCLEELLGHPRREAGRGGDLEGGYTLGVEEQGKAAEEIVGVRHTEQRVVGHHEIGVDALGRQALGHVAAERSGQCRDAAGLHRAGRRGMVGFDADDGDA